jgi:hypothetical protein
MNIYSILSIICFGFAIGIAFAWAGHIEEERNKAVKRSIIEQWDKFQQERAK